MGILSASPNSKTTTTESTSRRGDAPQLTIIAQGTEISGDVIVAGVIKVEGKIEGSIKSAAQVLVSKGGLVQGDINTREAVIGGQVRGTVHAEERVEVQATALIEGDIVTRRIQITEGGQVNGSISMGVGSGEVVNATTMKPDRTANISA